MRVGRALAPSLRALFAHRLRAALALASVAIGVAAVVLTSAIGKGARAEVLRRIEAAGTSLLVVRPAEVKRSAARKEVGGIATTLRLEDGEAIGELGLVSEAAPGVEETMRVKAGRRALLTTVVGTSPSFLRVRGFRTESGRFLDPDDEASADRVAVLGARVARALFPDADPTGQEIRVRGVPFEVVGVLAARGTMAEGSDEDNQVLVPVRTALRRVLNGRWLTSVLVQVISPTKRDEAAGEIRELLRDRHRREARGQPDDFAVQDRAKLLALQKQTADSLALLTTGLAALALGVGGVGILALMLLSVKERTAEIGLRMAVGARPRDVLVQFLVEATLLALGGWLGGVALGATAGLVVALGTEWKVAFPAEAALASLAMAVVTGLGFGSFPARQAARLSPIQALRTE
jgi:putative ABC transport system permease protein